MTNSPDMLSPIPFARPPLRGRHITVLAVVACILSLLYAIFHCGPSVLPQFARRRLGVPTDMSHVITKVDSTVDKIGNFVGNMEKSVASLKTSMAKRDEAMLAALKGGSMAASEVGLGSSVMGDNGCELSMRESHNFFCESDEDWHRRKERFVDQQSRQNSSGKDRSIMQDFWQTNYEPNFSCTFERRVGRAGDGGKWVCDPWRIRKASAANASRKCLVYSIGSNNNFWFETGIHKEIPQCEIHTFDHTVESPRPPPYVNFHKIGLSGTDKKKEMTYTLGTIMKTLGHDKDDYFVEIFKIDIERNEYEALLPVLENGKFTRVRQLQIELHPPKENVLYQKIHRFFELMYRNSWVIFHKEANILTKGTCVEYSFIKLDWDSPGLVAAFSE